MESNLAKYTTDGNVVFLSKEIDINKKLSNIIGSKFAKYREKWDKVNNFELVTEFPLFLHLDLFQVCNYQCPHCNISDPELLKVAYKGKISEKMDFNKYKKIVDEGSEYGCPSIEPQGVNEPLLVKDFEKYALYAHQKGFIDIMINTNASALTEKRAKKLLDSGLTRLRFSLDAYSPETYKKVRVGSLPLKKIVKQIETFLELKERGNYKLPVTGVSMCVLKQNQHEVDDFQKFWIDKVDMVTFQSFQPPNAKKDYSNFYPDETLKDKKKIKIKKNFRCPQPFQRVVIRNDLITACCNTFSTQLTLGNLSEGIYNAWNGKLANELRYIHQNGMYELNPTCKICVETTAN